MWNSLPMETVMADTINLFKKKLDIFLERYTGIYQISIHGKDVDPGNNPIDNPWSQEGIYCSPYEMSLDDMTLGFFVCLPLDQ
ncbi:hypothetical protein FKM82_024105 [Ascaphus truei]